MSPTSCQTAPPRASKYKLYQNEYDRVNLHIDLMVTIQAIEGRNNSHKSDTDLFNYASDKYQIMTKDMNKLL